MTANTQRAAEIQRQYYADTAGRYERMHAHEGAGDAFSGGLLHAIVRMVDAQSVLDVGTATGLSLRALKDALPHVSVCGIEPVRDLIRQAAANGQAALVPSFKPGARRCLFQTQASTWFASSQSSITSRSPQPS